MTMLTGMRIKAAGHMFDHLVIDSPECSCGDIDDGIGAHLRGNGDVGGFVLSWPDFEAAYLAVKKARQERSALPSGQESDGK